MSATFERIAGSFETQHGATESALEALVAAVGVDLPGDYLAFLAWSNGGEGSVGDNYLQVWSAERITRDPYPYGKWVPGLLFVASDGGEALFALDTSRAPMPVVVTNSDDLEPEGVVELAPSFLAFIELLEQFDWIAIRRDRRSRNRR
jgi:hypothetical protein